MIVNCKISVFLPRSRWDPKFDHESDAQPLYEILNLIRFETFTSMSLLDEKAKMVLHYSRDDCLANLGMADPPNPGQGYFYNVYIHHGQVVQ